jgi:CRP-like cAMP-binding protein
MQQVGTSISTAALQHFLRFQHLNQNELQALARELRIETARPGHRLFRTGDKDPRDIFLLSGELNLIADDGRSRPFIANSDAARIPVARLRPRQYTAVAKTAVTYFRIDACQVRPVVSVARAQHEPLITMEVAEISLEDFQRAQADYLQQRRNAA